MANEIADYIKQLHQQQDELIRKRTDETEEIFKLRERLAYAEEALKSYLWQVDLVGAEMKANQYFAKYSSEDSSQS